MPTLVRKFLSHVININEYFRINKTMILSNKLCSYRQYINLIVAIIWCICTYIHTCICMVCIYRFRCPLCSFRSTLHSRSHTFVFIPQTPSFNTLSLEYSPQWKRPLFFTCKIRHNTSAGITESTVHSPLFSSV